MKTLQKMLCVILSIIMAMSCLSVAAFAEGEEKFTSTIKAHSTMSNKQTAGVVLDELDEILASLNDGEGIYFDITSVLAEETGIKFSEPIVIDLRSVTAMCGTLDLLRRFIEVDSILDAGTTAIIRGVLGQLGDDINLKNWKTGMSRSKDDITILNELVEFLSDNRSVIEGIIKSNESNPYDMGIVNNFINVNELLGETGVSGIIKEMLVGMVYDEGTAEFNAALTDIDAFIYGDLIASFTKDMLPGLTVNSSSTIEMLLVDVYNITFDKYIKDALKGLNIDLSTSDIPELRALEEVIELKGITDEDLTGLTLTKDKSYKSQLNDIIGNYIKLIIPGYTGWTQGDYSALKGNLEKAIKYVANQSGVVKNADSKTLEEIGVEIALIILKNGDFGAYEEGLEDCDNLEDMVSALLRNTANEMKIGVTYDGSEDYLEVAGDIFAYWAYDSFNITDTNGKVYRAGGGKDVFEVANYFLNYFLFDRGAASALGLSTTKTETVFTKFDKLADYFGQNKAVDFNSKNFMLGTSSKKGLIDCILTLDIGALLDLTVIAALDDVGSVSAVEFIYKSVQYFLNNWAGKTLFPAYQTKAFQNALSNESIANMVSVLLETLNSRKASVITLATFAVALAVKGDETTDYAITSATIADIVATGKALAPKATVKAGGKTLTQGTDYMVLSQAAAPGTYTATIKGVGIYEGEIERDFNVKMGKVSSVSYTSTTSTVKLSWSKVPYADSYKITKYNSSTKKYDTVKTVTGTSYTVTGLSAGKEYSFKVQAISSAYGSTDAKAVTAYTIPSAVNASKVKTTSTPSSIKLTWSAVSGATHYRVEQYVSKKWKTITTTEKTGKTVTGLSGYTSYSFRIVALKKLSDGTYLEAAPSSTVKAKTTLGTPSSLTAEYSAKTITLTWSKVTNATKYQVQRYTGGKWKTIKTVTGTTYKISDLKTATKYKLAVRAAVKSGSSWIYGERKEITQYTGLAKPSSAKVSSSSITTTSAKLSWSKVSKADSYEVYAYIGGKWVKKGTTKKTAMTVKELPTGKKTKLKVRAVAKLGGKTVKGAFSSEVTVLTLVSKVSGLDTTLRKTTSISLKWKKVTGATSYQVYRYNGKKWVRVGTTSKTTYTDSKSLKKGTEYKYKVRAVQKVSSKTTCYGAFSSVLKAKTTRIGSSRF